MQDTKTVYVALSLTHVKTEAEKDEIRSFLRWLEVSFNIELLMWAFDVETWQPLLVENIYNHDSEKVALADLMIILYLSNDGSDGRGGEMVQRIYARRPMIAFAREEVRISRFPLDCLRHFNIPLVRFTDFRDLYLEIKKALDALK